jgi:hypothetical protein
LGRLSSRHSDSPDMARVSSFCKCLNSASLRGYWHIRLLLIIVIRHRFSFSFDFLSSVAPRIHSSTQIGKISPLFPCFFSIHSSYTQSITHLSDLSTRPWFLLLHLSLPGEIIVFPLSLVVIGSARQTSSSSLCLPVPREAAVCVQLGQPLRSIISWPAACSLPDDGKFGWTLGTSPMLLRIKAELQQEAEIHFEDVGASH